MSHTHLHLKEMIDRRGEIANYKSDQNKINRQKQKEIQQHESSQIGHCIVIQCGDIGLSALNEQGRIDKSKESRMDNTAHNIDGIFCSSQIFCAWKKNSVFLWERVADYQKERKRQEEQPDGYI